MKMRLPILLPLALLASPAAAQVGGTWHVSGAISDHPFAVDCTFTPQGATFTGTCTDTSSHKKYTLTHGTATGNKIEWGYPASAFFMKFDVVYAGTLDGDRISGSATASGRKGSFTATRK